MPCFIIFVAYFWVYSTGCSGEFHVVFKHFQNLESLISNILNLLPCKLRIVLTATIKWWSKFHIQILCYSFTRVNRFLLIPSHSLPGKQEIPSSSDFGHVNNSRSEYFFLDSELSNGKMKVQVKGAFKGRFFVTKKQ